MSSEEETTKIEEEPKKEAVADEENKGFTPGQVRRATSEQHEVAIGFALLSNHCFLPQHRT
jgi:hypothetical protein